EVVVGRIGDDLRMDYTAQGHVVGLAARVQQLAPPGGITVTEQTARLAAGFFDFLDRGEQNLKGASAPVRVFELRGPGQVRSRLENSRARGFSRFVGRERELALLERALRETQSGRPQVVLVTAEPGAGKSRLCHEFAERARGVTLHYARALSHGRMLPFHVIVALARSLFGVGEGASPSDVRDAVRRGLGNAQPGPSIGPGGPHGSRVSRLRPSVFKTAGRYSTTGSDPRTGSRPCAPGSRPGLAATHSSSRR